MLGSAEKAGKQVSGSMMEMLAKSELLGRAADVGKSLLDVFMGCTEASMEFQTSLAKLETIADTNSVAMENLSADLLSLSSDTGVAVTSLTESAYQAISASVDTAQAVEFVAQANELAVGGFTSTETAVDVLSTAINAYGLEVSEAGKLSDYLITTQNLGKTSVDQLASSVGKVIPLASAYNVEMDNLSSAYAVLTANGIATAETGTYLKSMLTELADSGSSVAGILQEETGMSFSELSASGKSLGDVLAIIGTSVNNDSTAFSNLWSSSEAGVGALSLLNAGTAKYNSVLNEMQSSTGAASKAYETMTDTAEKAQQRLSNAAENLKIAVGNSLLEAFTGLNNVGAEALNWLTEFTQEHETLVGGMTAGVSVAALLTVGFLGLSVAITTVKAATDALNASTGGVLKVVGLVIAGVSVLVGILAGIFSDGEEAVEDYNGTLAECRTEIDQTEAALYKAKQRYGENSDVVRELESDLEKLNKQYENGGGYLGELTQETEAAAERIDSLNESVQSQYEELDSMETAGFQAVSMLEALSEKSELTNSDLNMMQSYADYLNDNFNCNIQVNYDTGELTGFDPNVLTDQIMKQYDDKKLQISMDYLSSPDFIDSYQKTYEELLQVQDEYHDVMLTKGKEAEALYSDYLSKQGTALEEAAYKKYRAVQDEVDAATEALDSCQSTFDTLNDTFREHCYTVDDTGELYLKMRSSLRDLTDNTADFFELLYDTEDATQSAAAAYQKYQSDVERLCTAYDEAYASAYESFNGQFGLFDEASMESEEYLNSTVENAQKALDSQLSYWENYTANVEYMQGVTASQLGVTETQYDTLMSYIQSGTPEAIALVDDMQRQIESGNTETVAELAQTIENVDTQRQAASDATADWITNFSGQMNDLVSDMKESLDCSDESKAAAEAVIDSYASTILSGGTTAVEAARSVSSMVAQALSGTNISMPGSGSVQVEGHASGTTNAEDVFIAGENGAELILNHSGSTVFPASETQKIIDAVADYSDFSGGYAPEGKSVYSSSTVTNLAPEFYLTLNGGTDGLNQNKVKRWMKQIVDESFASVIRTNAPVYVI